ncbi:Uu.00g142940.m01.CDS01 [Anthostomella pinea]|uniref:Uu.00g142940.m01.CDS01 n=1 Tax=Anthostomella pinea TaxID=933095 RepID=A0AAI8VRH0_9PEZI|nr:Uu.00g142940.m01.CDS01 [Anthostomella pinea]
MISASHPSLQTDYSSGSFVENHQLNLSSHSRKIHHPIPHPPTHTHKKYAFLEATMKTSSLLWLTSLAVLTSGAALSKRAHETPEQFADNTAAFVKQGLCRSYISAHTKTDAQIDSTCTETCNTQPRPWGCLGSAQGSGIPTDLDPAGDEWITGKCLCEIPLAEEIFDLVVQALPVLGQALEAFVDVLCAAFFNVLAEVVLDVIPEVKAVTSAWSAAIKGAKTFAENGLEAVDYQKWIEDGCGDGPWVQNVNEIFDTLSGVKDDLGKSAGCLKKGGLCS